MRIVLFEDDHVQQLAPVTLARPAYTIGCGGERLVDWALATGSCVRGVVRPYLQAYQQAEYPELCPHNDADDGTLLINARVAPLGDNFERLSCMLRRPDELPVVQDGCLAAVVVPSAVNPLENAQQLAAHYVERGSQRRSNTHELKLFDHPHQIIQYHLQGLADSLTRRLRSGEYREVRDGVFIKSGQGLHEFVHTETSKGPIVIEERATIGPFACLKGPLYLERDSCVKEHACLNSGVMVGRQAKVGGEISASIIEAYSNKQHSGFLGHSYLGHWVNLGAGTSNSNLKNTYGTIRMETATEKIDTGMQFMGCIIGDYTKSAINTSIFTGKLIGACSMLYGFVTTNVPSFVNYARSFGQMTDMSPTVSAVTQRRAFKRRGIEQQAWHVELINEMYRQAAQGRQLADKPLSL